MSGLEAFAAPEPRCFSIQDRFEEALSAHHLSKALQGNLAGSFQASGNLFDRTTATIAGRGDLP